MGESLVERLLRASASRAPALWGLPKFPSPFDRAVKRAALSLLARRVISASANDAAERYSSFAGL